MFNAVVSVKLSIYDNTNMHTPSIYDLLLKNWTMSIIIQRFAAPDNSCLIQINNYQRESATRLPKK